MGEVGGIAIIADSQGAGEFTAYPDALRFIIAVRDAGIRVAAASSSKNAGLFLRQIRLDTFAGENGLESERVTPGLTLLEFFDADIIVSTLDEVDLPALSEGCVARKKEPPDSFS